jgi:hypothetical protein
MRWKGHVAYMEDRKNLHKILVRKPEGMRLLGSLRYRWEDSIRKDLWEIGADKSFIALKP